jgi:hypothetical protein
LKNDDQKTHPEVGPHYPLSGSICHTVRKSVVSPASGRRGGAITPTDHARVVHMGEVTYNIDLPLMAYALKRGALS